MKILITCDPEYSRGIPERIIWTVNKYTKHEVRGLFHKKGPSRYIGSIDLPTAWTYQRKEEIDEAIEWADIIHFSHASSPRTIGRSDIIGKKPIFWSMNAAWDPKKRIPPPKWYVNLWKEQDLKHVKRALIAEGWQRYGLWNGVDFVLLPGAFPIFSKEYIPTPVTGRIRRVCYGAMCKKNTLPAPKGFKETCAKLKGVEHKIMWRKPWKESMEEKASSWLAIDEVMTPIVHTSTFEYISLGVPVISHHDQLTIDTIKEVTGASSVPIIDSSFDSLKSTIDTYLRLPIDKMKTLSMLIRQWAERYMHPCDVAHRYVEFWESA